MFKKGDYIVVLKDTSSNNNWENFVLKQTITRETITPILTPAGRNNTDCEYGYSDFKEKDNFWRYATSEEIAEYDRLGKPFDVTTFTPFKLPDNWHILVTEENAEDVLTWRFEDIYNDKDKITFKNHLVGMTINHKGTQYVKGHNPKDDITDPDGHYDFGIEITYEQFKRYVLNKDLHKEDYTYLIELFKKLQIR
jgi:hypothetical protein